MIGTAISNLTEVFDVLQSAGVKYTVIQGWMNAPSIPPKQMSILTTSVERMVRILGMTRDEDHPKGYLYRIEGIRTRFYLMQKGSGFFPEPFESEMLARSERSQDTNGLIQPARQHVFTARLYWMLHRESAWANDPEFREVARQFVENQTGMAVPPPDFV